MALPQQEKESGPFIIELKLSKDVQPSDKSVWCMPTDDHFNDGN
jgi:hypothetical protein